MTKRIVSVLLLTIVLIFPMSTFATENSFTINGVTVTASSGKSVNNCSAYAGEILSKIWNYKGVTTIFNSPYNLLKNKTEEERKITESHVKEFIQNAPLGSRIRICNASDEISNNYDNSQYGHTMVLVAKNEEAGTFTTLESGWGAAEARTYTYKSFVDKWTNYSIGYKYFFYIADLTFFSSSGVTVTQYFSCNVKITCINGQTVNLYNNVGDSTRVTYFSKGQTTSSTYGAKLSDGSTWYRITANHNGVATTFWLKYESSKMTVTDIVSTCTVNFDANGGSVSETVRKVTKGNAIGTLPTPTRDGYKFLYWSVSKEGSDMVVTDPRFMVDRNYVLYARWEPNCTNHTYDAERCTKCGATLPYDNAFDASAADTYKVSANTAYVRTGPYQTKELVKTMNQGEKVEIVGSVINSYGNTWLKISDGYYIHAEKMTRSAILVPVRLQYNVILDDGVTCSRITVTNGKTYGALPVPQKDGYTFDGWYTSTSGGTQVTSSTIVRLTRNQTLYAHWTKNSVSYWTDWSDWSAIPVSGSSTRQVDTRSVRTSDGRTEYRYGRYIDAGARNDCWCAKYLEGLSYVSGNAILQYSDWSTVRYGVSGRDWSCGYCNGYHIGVDHVGSDGRSWWKEYILPNGSYYWEETRTTQAEYETQYRYRDFITQ